VLTIEVDPILPQRSNAMSAYNNIMVAIDLTEEAPQVLDKAQAMCEAHSATLTLVHVVEPVGYAYGGDIPMDLTELQDQLDQAAREQLAKYGEQYGVSKENQIVTVGRPESEVHRLTEERSTDLVIVGSHGRKGFQLLLGSTANGVLHGTVCDVLAVRIK
jgi:universal stress protein A